MNLITILKKLITLHTISSDKIGNAAALDFIQRKYLNFPGLYFKKFNSNGFPSLVVTTKKTKNPDLFLAVHLDVVEGASHLFHPQIAGDKLVGRGTFDMKYALACYLKFLNDLKNDLSSYNIGFIITADEELGGANGVKSILTQGYKAKVALLPDGGYDWNFEVAAKGAWHIQIKAKGKSAHGSRPWEGDNAIDKLIVFLNKISKLPILQPRTRKDHFYNTLNIGVIQGGHATNQVPDEAEAKVDIRFVNDVAGEKIKKQVFDLAKKQRDIIVEEINYGHSVVVDRSSKYLGVFRKILETRIGVRPGYISSHGSSDARYFAACHIPTIILRPPGGGHHSDREWISITGVKQFHQALEIFVKENFKKK